MAIIPGQDSKALTPVTRQTPIHEESGLALVPPRLASPADGIFGAVGSPSGPSSVSQPMFTPPGAPRGSLDPVESGADSFPVFLVFHEQGGVGCDERDQPDSAEHQEASDDHVRVSRLAGLGHAVADPVVGVDVDGLSGVVAEFLAQSLDVGAYDGGVLAVVATPDLA